MVLSEKDIDRIIEMAWEDRTPFEAIETQFGLQEKHVITLMRRYMTTSSFKMWRKRVNARSTKHLRKRDLRDKKMNFCLLNTMLPPFSLSLLFRQGENNSINMD